nr:hypothetical protein [Tanacetum cinerariifolium]
MDDFLSPSEWNGTAVSKGDPIPNNERPSIRTTTPLPVRLKDMERERNERRQTTFDQVERIKKLDEDHVPKSKQLYDAENEARALEEEKVRLLTSVEYQKSLVVPIGLSFTAGRLKFETKRRRD